MRLDAAGVYHSQRNSRFKLSSRTKNLPSKRQRNKTDTCPFSLARAAGFLNFR